ncbi:biotin--[acetyl-CoA-carboxylase] ligase [Bifidobacterium simiarum]|uniref:BPL/LPL catalytic domain-containing protein n=1 Tax=Bifidobacterium simiarum TaxID=2045441 RepID=A0A2M9HCP1_9BIFI|nr:biotin--[acetyl-CoA-carboxylase] ligase [Bifidobacterium simiarum]MBT1166000.1 biotin--[acetyl-CoA-carboxylase] ligase [Bifidobacterium simiarum]PJM74584.1 hypothetical protein CSQ87_09280 [Bifidobacterium simiarum]
MHDQQSEQIRSAWRGSLGHTKRAADSVWLSASADSTNSVIARAIADRNATDRKAGTSRPLNETVRTLFADPDSVSIAAKTDHTADDPGSDDPEADALAELTRRADVDYDANDADTAAAWLASAGLPPDPEALAVQVPVSVAIADTQTAGRGRLGRAWYNKAGESFIASYAVAVPKALAVGGSSGWLTMIAGLAALDALGAELTNDSARELDPEARFTLKWPNDVFLIGRKLGGILTELTAVDDEWAAVTFGIGLNLFVDPDELPTEDSTSLQLHYAPLPSYGELRDRLAAGMATALRVRLSAFASHPEIVGHLRGEVTDRSWTLGRKVRAQLVAGGAAAGSAADGKTCLGEVITGTAESINADASLTVRLADGTERTITTGDVGVLPDA